MWSSGPTGDRARSSFGKDGRKGGGESGTREVSERKRPADRERRGAGRARWRLGTRALAHSAPPPLPNRRKENLLYIVT